MPCGWCEDHARPRHAEMRSRVAATNAAVWDVRFCSEKVLRHFLEIHKSRNSQEIRISKSAPRLFRAFFARAKIKISAQRFGSERGCQGGCPAAELGVAILEGRVQAIKATKPCRVQGHMDDTKGAVELHRAHSGIEISGSTFRHPPIAHVYIPITLFVARFLKAGQGLAHLFP